MDSCKENRLKTQSEAECKLLTQKIDLLVQEQREQKEHARILEEQVKAHEETERGLRAMAEEQARVSDGVQTQWKIAAEKVEELRREVKQGKKAVEEWQAKCVRSEVQKSLSEQADVSGAYMIEIDE
eukprot:TRINITY_DN9696_c0_g1_i12.p3 TRINITY_DN9696_c0_g1~~TRINITY_DN9696_c0_g1_i12.p3  ORF type:complete len:127 (-),score=53.19 TRINITY_DN9696_c0_g1_i12:433-813(-)